MIFYVLMTNDFEVYFELLRLYGLWYLGIKIADIEFALQHATALQNMI